MEYLSIGSKDYNILSNLKLHMDELLRQIIYAVSHFYEQNLRFGQFLGWPAVDIFSAMLLKYPAYFSGFFNVFQGKKIQS